MTFESEDITKDYLRLGAGDHGGGIEAIVSVTIKKLIIIKKYQEISDETSITGNSTDQGRFTTTP